MRVSPEDLTGAFAKLPLVVREYIAGPDLGAAVSRIGTNQGLHVDTVGKLAESVMHMLLGFISPTELVSEVQGLGIERERAMNITKELNEQIFKPLHQKMRESGAGEPARVPAPPQTPVPAPLGRSEPVASIPPPPAPIQAAPVPPPAPAAAVEPAIVDPLPAYQPLPRRETPRPYIAPDIGGLPTPPPPKSYARDPYREPVE